MATVTREDAMREHVRRWLVGVTLGGLVAAGLTALIGPGLPAVAQSGRTAVALEPYVSQGALEDGEAVLSPVPVGQQLIVESVFAELAVPTGQHARLLLRVAENEVLVPTIGQGTLGGTDFFAPASPAVRIYLPAGPVLARGVTSAAGNANGLVTVVGQLVPGPAGPLP
jgi:hypothetical protein